MAGRKKSEYNDEFQPHIRINESDKNEFNQIVKSFYYNKVINSLNQTVSEKTKNRLIRQMKGLNRSKIFRDLIIKFNKNPQEVLDFINYDND